MCSHRPTRDHVYRIEQFVNVIEHVFGSRQCISIGIVMRHLDAQVITECEAFVESGPEWKNCELLLHAVYLSRRDFARARVHLHRMADERGDAARLFADAMMDALEGKRDPMPVADQLFPLADGTIFRDWREGIHGRREGYWNGAKSYLLCAHCHNPHAPRFQAMAPLPPPVRPQFLRAEAEDPHD